MNNSIKNTYIPKLRFKEFGEKYKLVSLKDISNHKKGQGFSKKDILADGKYKIILYGDLFTKYKSIITDVNEFTNKKGKILSKLNSLLFPSSSTSLNDFFPSSSIKIKNVILGSDINIFEINSENNSDYFAFLFSNKNHLKKIQALTEGSTINHLYGKHLEEYKIIIPYLKEQDKIAKFFSLLDQQISLLENKLQLIEQIIKYILSFKLRYTNKKIGDEFYLFDGFPFKSTDYDENGKKEILTIKNIGINKLELKKINRTNKIIENKYEINKNEIICSLTGAAGFKFSLSDSNYYFNQRTLKIISKKNEFHQILMLLLLFRKNKDFISNLATGSQQNISKKDIENLNFLKNESRNIFIAKILNKIDKYVNMLITVKELKIKRKNYYLKKILL